jgi:hypothetical protein
MFVSRQIGHSAAGGASESNCYSKMAIRQVLGVPKLALGSHSLENGEFRKAG